MRAIATTLVFTLSILVGSNAFAGPTTVDCSRLKTAIDNADTYLDSNNISFGSLGKLVSTAFLDPVQGANLVGLLNQFYSGNPSVPFTSPKQLFTSISSCGLTPFLIQQIND